MFPPVYNHNAFMVSESDLEGVFCISVDDEASNLKSVDTTLSHGPVEDHNDDKCVVYDCELEPFEYLGRLPSDKDSSLTSVFGDETLANEIFNSLKTEPNNAPVASNVVPIAPLSIKAPMFPANMSISIPATPMSVLLSVPCIRKPGTFLNKDGRWIKGKPCRMDNCDKRAQSNGLCKGHGGGARCSKEGCNKSSQGGGFCRAHGGGKRCMFEGCEKGTQRNGFCYLHGGVRSCSVEGCEKKDRGNGKCFSHGGGRRCQAAYCAQPIRRGTYCERHQLAIKTAAVQQ